MTYLSTERMAGVPTCAGLGTTRGDYIGGLGISPLTRLKNKVVSKASAMMAVSQGWRQIGTQEGWIIEQNQPADKSMPKIRARAPWGETSPEFVSREDLNTHVKNRAEARKALEAAVPSAAAPAITSSASATTSSAPVPGPSGEGGPPGAGAGDFKIPMWAWAAGGIGAVGLLLLLLKR